MPAISPATTFVVIQNRAVVFSCGTLDEGLAFLEGRGDGVLYRLLCEPRAVASRVQQKRPRKRQKIKA